MSDLIDSPKHNDLIYDVGMHKGEDTEFYLRKGFRVIAFEANPELVDLCRVRLKRFIEQGQLKIVEGAIVDKKEIEAGRQKVPFLGEVPIFTEIREGGDQGVPVVVSAPEGPAAKAFIQIASSLRT